MSCALLFRSHCGLHPVGGWGAEYAKPYITASVTSRSFPRLSIPLTRSKTGNQIKDISSSKPVQHYIMLICSGCVDLRYFCFAF